MVLYLYEERRFEYEDTNETCPKTSVVYKSQILEFDYYVVNLQKTYNFELCQITNMDEVPLTLMCHSTELWTSKEQRPWLLKLLVMRKHISLLF